MRARRAASPLPACRAGVTAAFALAGALVGVFTARIPALMDELRMSTLQLGVVLLLWGLGAVATMQALRWVVVRTGSAVVLRVAAPLGGVALAAIGCVPTFALLLAVVTAFGVTFGAVEVTAKEIGSPANSLRRADADAGPSTMDLSAHSPSAPPPDTRRRAGGRGPRRASRGGLNARRVRRFRPPGRRPSAAGRPVGVG
jgi:hypothetical protein